MRNPDSRPVLPAYQAFRPRMYAVAILATAMIGTALRSAYISQDYFNPDESVAVAVVKNLEFPSQWDTNWALTDVRDGFRYDQYNFSSYHYTLYGWKLLLQAFGVAEQEGSLQERGAWRSLNVLFGLVAIICTGMVARRLAGDFAGLAAAALMAVAPVLVQDAHYLRSDAMLTGGFAVAIWLLADGTRRSSIRTILAGVTLGWLIASKVSLLIAGLAMPFALARLAQASPTPISSWLRFAGFFGVGMVIGFAAGVPFGVVHPNTYLAGIAELQRQYSSPLLPHTDPQLSPSFRIAAEYFVVSLGWGVFAASVVGLGALVRKRGWSTSLKFALPLVAAGVTFGSHALFSERSYSPFLPCLAVLCGSGAQHLLDWLKRIRPSSGSGHPILATAFLVALLTVPATLSYRLIRLGFSGKEKTAQNVALDAAQARFPEARLRITGLTRLEEFEAAVAEVRHDPPVLLAVCDYYDTHTPFWLNRLQTEHGGKVVAVREGIFSGLPVCSLHTYFSPRVWFLLFSDTAEFAATSDSGGLIDLGILENLNAGPSSGKPAAPSPGTGEI